MTKEWFRRRKIASLPGARVDPAMVLSRTLEKAQSGEVLSVAVVIRWKDGTHSMDWSEMKFSEFSHMAMCMMFEALNPGATDAGESRLAE